MEELADGLRWEITPGDHDEIGPWHEEPLTPLVLGLLPEGGVFLDVGAHVGHYALRAAVKASRVIAVEPNPDTAARLRHNAAINGLGNIHVLEAAAWDGTARFDLFKVHHCYVRDGSNRIIADESGSIWGVRLDDALSQYPLRPDRLDLVKVDTEGADIEALDGMSGLLERHRPVLFIEDHSVYGYYDQAALLALLDRLGYAPELVMWGNSPYWLARPVLAASTAPAPS